MSDQLMIALALTGIALLCILLWGLSIAVVYWDVDRRQLPGREQLAWIGLTILLPMIGIFAYLFTRMLDVFLSPRPQGDPARAQRVTALKRMDGYEERLPTVAAAELSRETIAELKPTTEERKLSNGFTYSLAVVDGPGTGREYLISRLPVSIGRGPQAEICLDEDLGVSRRHAEIYARQGVIRIRDLKSTHGTLVNGYSIDDKSLDHGDRIKVGMSTLLFIGECKR